MPPEAQQILIIDNDAARRQLIEQILGDDGFAVTTVAEGFSAIRQRVAASQTSPASLRARS